MARADASCASDTFTVSSHAIDARTHRYTVGTGGVAALPWAEVITLWRTDRTFALFFSSILAAVPFDSFYWECPPLSVATRAKPFEFVAVQGRGFAPANPLDFKEHLEGEEEAGAATFANLGRDATLVSPTGDPVMDPGPGRAAYGHIAAFVRGAPEGQQVALWQAVGAALATSGSQPVWLSTEGSGVPWLHVRLDSRPKYYHHRPYTQQG